jgi:hypothetical protein
MKTIVPFFRRQQVEHWLEGAVLFLKIEPEQAVQHK